MNTIYKTKVASPYQPPVKRDVFNVSNKNHPIKELIQKYTGIYNLTATFEEDKETAQKLSHFSGVVAFICTIRKNGQVVGIGRSHNILSPNNKFLGKVINASFSYSFIDAISKTTRAMDTFLVDQNIPTQSVVATTDSNYVSKDSYESEMITEKQRSYLLELVNTSSIISDEEKNHWSSTVDDLTKDEASNAIKSFVN